ncbi:MAG: tail fiber domain-containing protein [Massilioclostridium sp.]|nr:tail fiber domain-containing protein [Massilioclostridium sp.]MEE1491206.1 tail fiber domain-containing protein [Massilioclostridium sp.]
MPKAVAQFTIYDLYDITASSTAPENPLTDQMWLDSSVIPPVLKMWDGTKWVIVNDYSGEIETVTENIATLTQESDRIKGVVEENTKTIDLHGNTLIQKVDKSTFDQTAEEFTLQFETLGMDGYSQKGKTSVDVNGIKIFEGALKIYDKAGNLVFGADDLGRVYVQRLGTPDSVSKFYAVVGARKNETVDSGAGFFIYDERDPDIYPRIFSVWNSGSTDNIGTTITARGGHLDLVINDRNTKEEKAFSVLHNNGMRTYMTDRNRKFFLNIEHSDTSTPYINLTPNSMTVRGGADSWMLLDPTTLYVSPCSGTYINYKNTGASMITSANYRHFLIADSTHTVLCWSNQDSSNGYTALVLEQGNIKVEENNYWKYLIKSDNIQEVMKTWMSSTGDYIHVITPGDGVWGISVFESDNRAKINVQEANVEALNVIRKIKHRSFNWKSSGEFQKLGYVAQELEEIDPDLVLKIPQPEDIEEDYHYQIDPTKLIPVITKAMQEQQQQIDQLNQLVKEMGQTMQRMNEEIKELKGAI